MWSEALRGHSDCVRKAPRRLLLAAGRKDYHDLHMMLDTRMFLFVGLLALVVLADRNAARGDSFPRWIAITFTLTSLSDRFMP